MASVALLDNLKKEIKYLPFPRKLVLGAGFFTLLFLFFPWGTRGVQQGESYEFAPESFGAFGIFSVFGWLLLLLILGELFLLWREITPKKTHLLSTPHSLWWILLGGMGTYTILLALFVLNSAYLKSFDSQFSLKIGIFLALFMQGVVLFAGVLAKKEEEKDYLKEALSHPHHVDTSKARLVPEDPSSEQQMSLGDYER